jgi:propionyl-CoA carboxylase beta chain
VGVYDKGNRVEATDPAVTKTRLVNEFNDKFANPYVAAGHGFIDEVIEPAVTRGKLIRALSLLQNKRDTNPPKKHGNIPL